MTANPEDVFMQGTNKEIQTALRSITQIIDQPIYDTVEINNVTTDVEFFAQERGKPQNISGRIKTNWDTNMIEARRMPADKAFLIKAIGFFVKNDWIANNTRVLEVMPWIIDWAWFKMVMQDKEILTSLPRLHPSGSGFITQAAYDSAAPQIFESVQLGIADSRAVRPLQKPILLASQVPFDFHYELSKVLPIADPDAKILLTCVFYGLMGRPVK